MVTNDSLQELIDALSGPSRHLFSQNWAFHPKHLHGALRLSCISAMVTVNMIAYRHLQMSYLKPLLLSFPFPPNSGTELTPHLRLLAF